MEGLPPRFSPDNSEEARARRIASVSDFTYEHALSWVRFKNISRPEPYDDFGTTEPGVFYPDFEPPETPNK